MKHEDLAKLMSTRETRTFRREVGGERVSGQVIGRGDAVVSMAGRDAERVWVVRDDAGAEHSICAEEWEVLPEGRSPVGASRRR